MYTSTGKQHGERSRLTAAQGKRAAWEAYKRRCKEDQDHLTSRPRLQLHGSLCFKVRLRNMDDESVISVIKRFIKKVMLGVNVTQVKK